MPGYHKLDPPSLDVIQDYFSHLNPIAQRIAYDINDTKITYGQFWQVLTHNEQNDILNETLIKPELSLKYLDNFVASSNNTLSKSFHCNSLDSLESAVLNNLKDKSMCAQTHYGNKSEDSVLKPLAISEEKNCYAFDGRDIKTFALQKVALKVIKDDALGTFRDEHSRPFSYRTKSQINLNLFSGTERSNSRVVRQNHEENDDKRPKKSENAPINYHILQCQLNGKNVVNINNDESTNEQNSQPVFVKPSLSANTSSIINVPASKNNVKIIRKRGNNKYEKTNLLQAYIDSTIKSTSQINFAVYSDIYIESEESSNLMQHCGNRGSFPIFSSSVATSDDDDDITVCRGYDIEKTLREDAKLLDRDINMRKGFDFLNNW